MTLTPLTRSKIEAFLTHLVSSAIVIAIYLALVRFAWYPEPYFHLEQVFAVVGLVVGVDLILGPALTFVVFKPGKASLTFDLGIIVLCQLVALSWGCWITYSQRPLYVAFADEMFSVIPARDIDVNTIPDSSLRNAGWQGPRLVYVDLPRDAATLKKLVEEGMASGRKAAARGEFYRPLGEHLPAIKQLGLPIEARIKEHPEIQQLVDSVLQRHGGSLPDYWYFPVEGRQVVALLILLAKTGEFVDIVGIPE